MGSWSVYCSLSNITITSGTPAVLIPLFKDRYAMDYRDTFCYTLPIFGEYDDYGGIENIQKDWNTELIEKVHNCTIELFCHDLCRKDVSERDCNPEVLEQLEKVTYMWVHGEVYNFLAKTFRPKSYDRVGDFDFGKRAILEKLGFEYVGQSNDPRYVNLYKYKEHQFIADGTWGHFLLENGKQASCYNIADLKKHIPEIDISYFKDKEAQDLYELYSISDRFARLYAPLGYNRSLMSMYDLRKRLIERDAEMSDEEADDIAFGGFGDNLKMTKMQKEYLQLFSNNDFCQVLAELVRILKSCNSYSKQFEEYVLYRTPQCGEFEVHQRILDKFAEINREMFEEEDDEEEDEELVEE